MRVSDQLYSVSTYNRMVCRDGDLAIERHRCLKTSKVEEFSNRSSMHKLFIYTCVERVLQSMCQVQQIGGDQVRYGCASDERSHGDVHHSHK